MTDSCEIDIEVGGSVAISDAEERVIESRRDSIAIEESAEEEANSRYAVEKVVAWKIFKSIVFVICFIFLVEQSVGFLRMYHKYPTNIQLETTLPKMFKVPAITLCFRSTISFKDFCSYEPNRCKRPSDMEEFCRKNPIHCEGDTSNLTIPRQDIYTRMIMRSYLFNDSYNDALVFRNYRYKSKARTFVEDIDDSDLFLKCYSENLHLYRSGSKPETEKLKFKSRRGHELKSYMLDMRNIELFYPLNHPLVFIGIHSPFVPLDPELNLYPLRRGAYNRVYVQLEKEEHLLPPPYQTNCSDNGPSEDAKESTNPNSFQVCQEMCRSEYTKAGDGCDWGLTMISSPSDLCFRGREEIDLSNEQRRELEKKDLICVQHCKQECMKLHYKYKVKETNNYWALKETISFTHIYVKNPEVTVLRHIPLYGSSEIFSNVGGLLGCWLGVSVFTFTEILEKFFRKVIRWKRRFRKRRFTLRRLRRRTEQGAPTSEIHHE